MVLNRKAITAVLLLHLSFLVAGQGTQFITGPCKSDADCASGCCGFKSGKCAGPVVAQERDGGCGFGDPQPNDRAAQAFRSGQAAPPPPPSATSANLAAGATSSAAAAAAAPSGTQFITGACKSDADCASGCCGFNSGKCAGPVVAQERDGGCGFGDPQPNDRAAQAFRAAQAASSPASPPPPSAPLPPAVTAANAGTGTSPAVPAGTQFITGACKSDADCASGCCGFNSGKCAGPVVAQERDGGCGFGDAQPNDRAAQAFRNGQSANAAAAAASSSASAAAAPPPPPAAAPAAGANGAGNGAGKQFITGPCTNDADCASGCCGFKSGKCAGAIVAQERDGGCGFGDAQPNDIAAQKLRGKRYVARELLFGH